MGVKISEGDKYVRKGFIKPWNKEPSQTIYKRKTAVDDQSKMPSKLATAKLSLLFAFLGKAISGLLLKIF